MLDLYRTSLIYQYDASLATLESTAQLAGESLWGLRIGSYQLGRCVFHALLFADLYLNKDEVSFRKQEFHRQHPGIFEDYAELKFDVIPGPAPDRAATMAYLEHCRRLARSVVAAETETSLEQLAGYAWTPLKRAELHVYNIRHLQHHAAQISLRLRAEANMEVPWIKSGWPVSD